MSGLRVAIVLTALLGASQAGCPFMDGGASLERRQAPADHPAVAAAAPQADILEAFTVNNTDGFLTTDVGGPMEDQNSLSVGDSGPTLLEDFIFRQKIMHFDHERVPERAVHARGAGAHGVFESYGDWSNITAASFLSQAGKKTPTFVRFSTVAGSRGSADTARDVHGFATRLYTDEGNYDIVGNNIPVFFIQDAILFPDLIHAVKPEPDREMPQAATAHDTAWDFFSSQPSTLHTLFWAMSQQGIVRSYRLIDGFGVHAFRLVKDDGSSKLVKFHWKSLQGKAGLLWEEAQQVSGQNPDYHREDLWEAIEKGNYPEWELGVQIVNEGDNLRYGFDILDPTKIIPEEFVPVTPLGKMTLNRNTDNYFAETEQIMFQPSHVVRGIDFSEDPLLQGRLFSYLDTQLNRHGGPNFEQLPINAPRVAVRNNNRDGQAQMYIHAGKTAYSPNTVNNGAPKQATQQTGRGFFTANGRGAQGRFVRAVSPTFQDVWSQPRLFYNSLTPAEQQLLINAIRFEVSHVTSPVIKENVIKQLNRVSNEIAVRVADAVGVEPPTPDPTYYHQNKTTGVSIANPGLKSIKGLKVGLLTSTSAPNPADVATIKGGLKQEGVDLVVVGETLAEGIDKTYAAVDAILFDAVVVANGAGKLFNNKLGTTLFPPRRPTNIVADAYRFGKAIATIGDGSKALEAAQIDLGLGVYQDESASQVVQQLIPALHQFKFYNRIPVDVAPGGSGNAFKNSTARL